MKTAAPVGVLTIAALSAMWSSRVLAFQAHRVDASAPPAITPAPTPSTRPAKSPPLAASATSDSILDHLDCENWVHNEKTQKGSCDNFTYFEPDSHTTVTGPHAIYDDKQKILNTSGDLTLDDDKHHVTASKADVYYGPKKLAVLTGNVIIVLKPAKDADASAQPAPGQPGGAQSSGAQQAAPGASQDESSHDTKAERGHGGTITCDHVDDYYKKKFVVLQGHLVFTQQLHKEDRIVTRTMTAEHGEYDGKAEILHLFPPVHCSDTEGHTIDFEKDAYVGTHEGEETVSSKGKVHMSGPSKDYNGEDDDPADTKAALKGTTTPPQPPAKPDGTGKQVQR